MDRPVDRPELLLVPVRSGTSCSIRTGRLPDGTRTGFAFTSAESLRAGMGPGCEHLVMTLGYLHGLLGPLGTSRVQVDPLLVAPFLPVIAA